MKKEILDVTCGSRSIWFNKHHPAAIYTDGRKETFTSEYQGVKRSIVIAPDIVCDFTNLPFDSESFSLVVFDPPHLIDARHTAWLVKRYGCLEENWQQMLRDGYRECMRVLKPNGILIFKWAETQIPASAVWDAIGEKPLFGHHSGKKSKTFWACFMKLEKEAME